jgi:hypothetical protein
MSSHRFQHVLRTTHIFNVAVFALALVLNASAQAPAPELLNSERIAQRFGSYGIEVVESGRDSRVAHLFSTEQGSRTCRTFAVVRYPEAVHPMFAAEHAEILQGGSIGAVFAARGWQVRKSHLHYGELNASGRLAEIMQVAAGTRLAEHVYALDIVKDGSAFPYAAIVEIHHPDYLLAAQLPSIYGPANPRGNERLVDALLATAADRAGR